MKALAVAVALAVATPCHAGNQVLTTETCAASGGTLVDAYAGPVCAMPEPDAGAACTGSEQCSGVCLAETRTCAPLRPMIGCFEYIHQGEILEICVD